MKDQHRATADEWTSVKALASGGVAYSCILELRDRIQALEAAQHAHVDLSHLSDAERERMLKSIANPGRFEALEATQPEHLIDPEREKMAQEFMQAAGFAPRSSEGELRAAAQPAKSNHPAKPDSSLVEQVTDALVDVEAIDEDDDDPTYKYTSDAIRNGEGVIHLQARAAIRVIASELRAQGFVYAADWLEQEADQ